MSGKIPSRNLREFAYDCPCTSPPFYIPLPLNRANPLALYAQGFLAMAENDWMTAVDRLEAFCHENPDVESVHYDLARSLFFKGEPKKAREQYLVYLNGETDPSLERQALQAISYIDTNVNTNGTLYIVK
jgi:hypothetical protein